MKSRLRSRGELIFSGFLLILGVVIMVASLQIGFGRFTRPGPGLFPFFCGLILCLHSAALLVTSPKRERAADDAASPAGNPAAYFWMMGCFVLWILLMPVLGWLPLTFAVPLAIAKIMGMEGWMKPLLLAGANTVFSYLLFGYLLAIDLPNGFWM